MTWYHRASFLTLAFFVSRLISLIPEVMSVILFTGALLVIVLDWLAQREKGNL